MKTFLTPVKVGILAVAAIAGFTYTMHSVQQGSLGSGDTYGVYAMLNNVLGLANRSRVVMAGIEVGHIDSIVLVHNKARVNLRIKNEVPLYADASLSKISESLLGDKLITLDAGHQTNQRLKDGSQILYVYEETDITTMFRRMNDITADVQAVTESLRKMVGMMDEDHAMGGMMRRMSEISDNLIVLTQQVNESFAHSSQKIEHILGDVARVTSGTNASYNEILENVRVVSGDLIKLVNNLNSIVGQDGKQLKQDATGIKESLAHASRSLENLNSITRKIDEGEGTLGKLVNEDKFLNKAESILDDASTITSKLARLRTEIDLHSEFHMDFLLDGDNAEDKKERTVIKNYLALKLIPKSDKYYMLEVIDDPRGSVELVTTEVKSCSIPNTSVDQCPEGQVVTNTNQETTVKDEFKFSLQFFKRYYWLGLRFGIIENSGGLGVNFFLLNDDLELKLDLFQFSQDEYGRAKDWPRLKAMAVYRPSWLANHVYVAAGADDFLNYKSNDYRLDFFLSLGIHFDDEDLKTIFTTIGTPKM